MVASDVREMLRCKPGDEGLVGGVSIDDGDAGEPSLLATVEIEGVRPGSGEFDVGDCVQSTEPK
jgi:hypothetical protein